MADDSVGLLEALRKVTADGFFAIVRVDATTGAATVFARG